MSTKAPNTQVLFDFLFKMHSCPLIHARRVVEKTPKQKKLFERLQKLFFFVLNESNSAKICWIVKVRAKITKTLIKCRLLVLENRVNVMLGLVSQVLSFFRPYKMNIARNYAHLIKPSMEKRNTRSPYDARRLFFVAKCNFWSKMKIVFFFSRSA